MSIERTPVGIAAPVQQTPVGHPPRDRAPGIDMSRTRTLTSLGSAGDSSQLIGTGATQPTRPPRPGRTGRAASKRVVSRDHIQDADRQPQPPTSHVLSVPAVTLRTWTSLLPLLTLVIGALLGALAVLVWSRRAGDPDVLRALSARGDDQAVLRDGLDRLHERLMDVEQQRASWQGQLRQQVDDMRHSTDLLRRETGALSTALRKPHVRGQWGELHLRRAVELAGMVEHCDFQEQVHLTREDGNLRPDLVVRLAGGRSVVVDAKVPLDAHLDALGVRRPGGGRRPPAAPRPAGAQPRRRARGQGLLALDAGSPRVRGDVRPGRVLPRRGAGHRPLPADVRRHARRRHRHPDDADRPAAHRRARLDHRGAGGAHPRDPRARTRAAHPDRRDGRPPRQGRPLPQGSRRGLQQRCRLHREPGAGHRPPVRGHRRHQGGARPGGAGDPGPSAPHRRRAARRGGRGASRAASATPTSTRAAPGESRRSSA